MKIYSILVVTDKREQKVQINSQGNSKNWGPKYFSYGPFILQDAEMSKSHFRASELTALYSYGQEWRKPISQLWLRLFLTK